MNKQKSLQINIVESLKKNDIEQVLHLLEEEIELLQNEAFIQGYEYAIAVLQETLVRVPMDD